MGNVMASSATVLADILLYSLIRIPTQIKHINKPNLKYLSFSDIIKTKLFENNKIINYIVTFNRRLP